MVAFVNGKPSLRQRIKELESKNRKLVEIGMTLKLENIQLKAEVEAYRSDKPDKEAMVQEVTMEVLRRFGLAKPVVNTGEAPKIIAP